MIARRSVLTASFVLASLVALPTADAGPPLVPPQLVAACAKLPEGAPCSVQFGEKTVRGVCAPMPDRSLACMPPKKGRSAKPPRPPKGP